jgi:voltage-gated potassium channel
MTTFLVTIVRIVRAFGQGMKDAEFRALFFVLLGLIGSGTVFYSTVEGWGVLDAMYFSVTTLATVGFGDLHPSTPLSKAFTMAYIVLGVGVFVAFITRVTAYQTRRRRHADRKAGDQP